MFKYFLKRNKKPVTTVSIGVVLFICFKVLNHIGNGWRGYEAVGGEVFVFLMPFLIVKLRDLIIDIFKE